MTPHAQRRASAKTREGSVLIIVLWVCFGLVSLTLYFAHSMSMELRASNNRLAGAEAEMAIDGAAQYVSNILARLEEPGEIPDRDTYGREAMPVGNAYFWFLGRPEAEEQLAPDQASFALVDEASKIHLNTAPAAMLEGLPGMTAELAAAIVDWRDEDSDVTSGGAEDDTYLRLTPAYHCKNLPFETVGELRLVTGFELVFLFGEDANLNGVLDPNENDGDVTPPFDNANGRLEAGLLEYVTVYSRESNLREDGTQKINVADNNPQALREFLRETFSEDRAGEIMGRLNGPPGSIDSLLALYMRSGMTEDEWAQVSGELAATDEPYTEGLINVNTASEAVLAAIPGIGADNASKLLAHRGSNPDSLNSLAWVAEVLEQEDALQAGPFLTALSHQFTADIAAVGRQGKGYRRVKLVFDTSEGRPKSLFRQDLSHMGWALGWRTRELLKEAGRVSL